MDQAAASDPCEFKGGLRTRWMNVTWPEVTLIADGERLTIRANGWTDDVKLDRADCTGVRSARGILPGSRGLRFDTKDGRYDRIIFWTPPFRHKEVKEALHSRGWPTR